MYSHFDQNHWFKVKAARLRQGIENKSEAGSPVQCVTTEIGKLYVGTVLKSTDGSVHEVTSITKDWDRGWFFSVSTNSGSRAHHFFVSTIDCGQEWILDEVAEFKEKFTVVGYIPESKVR